MAARLTSAVQGELDGAHLDKRDKSPVTVADFGAQALVCRTLMARFGEDAVVGEETSVEVGGPAHAAFRAEVVRRVAATLAREVSEAEVLGWVDRGRGRSGERFWTVDPVDGTKGFIRGQHYAIALALIEGGQPVVAALACPRLSHPSGGDGTVFVAVVSEGTQMLPLFGEATEGPRVHVSGAARMAQMRLVESVESAHSDHAAASALRTRLGIVRDSVRIDSQVKYGVVARGEAEIYLRLPTRPDYEEKIWDHAAGCLVVQEAGGRVTDARGRPLDFSTGTTLDNNVGILATNGWAHDAVLAAL